MMSTNNLSKVSSRNELRRQHQSLATLEAIIERDWASRYYSFNKNWDEGGEQLASMRNGEGDSWFCVFSPQGAFLKGFDHECELASRIHGNAFKWPGLLDQVPRVFESYIKEPAFSMRETTFCIWQTAADSSWHTGPHILQNSTI